MVGAEELACVRPFDRLTPAHRSLIASTAREVTFPSGTTIFFDGQRANGCWLIRAGHVALGTEVPGRGQVVVQTVGPGEVLGWSWLVPPYHWHFTASANSAVSALVFDTTRLRALADEDPALGYALSLGLLQIVVARLQSTRSRLLDLYGSPRDR